MVREGFRNKNQAPKKKRSKPNVSFTPTTFCFKENQAFIGIYTLKKFFSLIFCIHEVNDRRQSITKENPL